MSPKSPRKPLSKPSSAGTTLKMIALGLVCATALLSLGQAAPSSGKQKPRSMLLPVPAPLPLPVPVPSPNLETSLAPPELPKIPSLPQLLPGNAPGPSSSHELPVTPATYDARILIVSADGNEPVLGMIRQVVHMREYAPDPFDRGRAVVQGDVVGDGVEVGQRRR